jgi:outer membrane protein insertion porin family
MKMEGVGRKGIFFVYILVITLLLTISVRASEPPKITGIEVKGNKRIEESAIKYMLESKVGDTYSPAKVRKDIDKLYQSDYFANVKVDLVSQEQGVQLIYSVVEKPIVERVVIIGNKDVESEDIEEKLGVEPHSILDHSSINIGVRNIKDLYQEKGFSLTEVKPVIKEMVGNQVRLEIKIIEGKKFKIGKIEFQENKVFSGKKLKKVIMTKEKGMISSIFGQDLYRPLLIKDDLMRLKAFYNDHGYIDVRTKLLPVNLNSSMEKINLKILIQEGEQYRVGNVDIQGEDGIYTAKELAVGLKCKPGEIFGRANLRDDMEFLTAAFTQKGFAFTEVDPLTDIDNVKKRINVAFAIEKGEKMYIGRINIKGNTKTMDKIIRREIPLNEGEIYDSNLLTASQGRLKGLGYFEDVEIKSERRRRGEERLVDIDRADRKTYW